MPQACASSAACPIIARSWRRIISPEAAACSIGGTYCVGKKKCLQYNMGSKILEEGFTFDDVLIRPAASSIEPAEAGLNTTIAGINLKYPFLSAPMDRA